MTDQEIAEIEQRLTAASPGEWVVVSTWEGSEGRQYPLNNPIVKRVTTDNHGLPATRNVATVGNGNHCNFKDPRRIQQERDAAFIARSKTDIAALLAEVRRLRG